MNIVCFSNRVILMCDVNMPHSISINVMYIVVKRDISINVTTLIVAQIWNRLQTLQC